MDYPKKLQPNIYYRHYELNASFPVIGLLGSSWNIAPLSEAELPARLHFHNCLEVGLLYKGRCCLSVNDEQFTFEAPALTILPPNVPHLTFTAEGSLCGWKWLYVDPMQLLPDLPPRLADQLNQYKRELTGCDCIIPAAAEPKAYALVEMIVDEMENNCPNYRAVVRELFYALFLILMRMSLTAHASEQRFNSRLGSISPAISYIANNYMNDLSVEGLAQLCHLSTSHFRRLFKQILGLSPQEYIEMIRVERACMLLYNNKHSITEISIQVGYPSPSSFSRQFKRVYNISPSRWRHKMQSEENPDVTVYLNSLPPLPK